MSISFLLLVAAGIGALVILLLGLVFLGVLAARSIGGGQGGTRLASDKTEAAVSVVAALFVLFSAMLNPLLSVGLAIVFLLAVAVYKLLPQDRVS